MRIKTGALQPWPVRQVTTPWPYCPPKIKAPFFIPGTTPTQVACSRIFSGMLLSWAFMISSRTILAASMRACKSSREEAAYAALLSMKQAKSIRQMEEMIFFISESFSLRGHSRRGWLFSEESPSTAITDMGQTEEYRGRGNPNPSINHPLAKMQQHAATA